MLPTRCHRPITGRGPHSPAWAAAARFAASPVWFYSGAEGLDPQMEAKEGGGELFKLRERVDLRVDQVLSAHARSEAKEEELRATPRWRFRRRRNSSAHSGGGKLGSRPCGKALSPLPTATTIR